MRETAEYLFSFFYYILNEVLIKMYDKEEKKVIHEGLVVEAFPNAMFHVRLDNETVILGYISGKIRRNSIRILLGDRVKIEVSPYDATKGRIIYRFPRVKNDSDDSED